MPKPSRGKGKKKNNGKLMTEATEPEIETKRIVTPENVLIMSVGRNDFAAENEAREQKRLDSWLHSKVAQRNKNKIVNFIKGQINIDVSDAIIPEQSGKYGIVVNSKQLGHKREQIGMLSQRYGGGFFTIQSGERGTDIIRIGKRLINADRY